jgi:hypothetical protein
MNEGVSRPTLSAMSVILTDGPIPTEYAVFGVCETCSGICRFASTVEKNPSFLDIVSPVVDTIIVPSPSEHPMDSVLLFLKARRDIAGLDASGVEPTPKI